MLFGVPPKKNPAPQPGTSRYPHSAIALEIERILDRGERGTKKRAAQAAGLDPSSLRNRITEREGYRFSVDEIGAIAQELGAPTGWPFVPWEEGERWDAFRTLMEHAPK